ncbi:MAG: M20/M25/M40 family metallo-hydrolase [Bacteroidetes bacterium]|nr:M20/M25/M40 family metallo-hydrolase [Bacteroidota bacterium]MBS1973233.1 M20/M25/M40 family metallo-hydrolase [Bacteroidota bacterium]
MTRFSLLALSALLLFHFSAFSQKFKKADKLIIANLEKNIRYLADDKLEGRRAGTAGEKLASDYIIAQFQSAGLDKIEEGSWLQPFAIYDGKQVDSTTRFIINGKELALNKDFFPLPFSATKNVSGTLAIALQESGAPWFVDLKDLLEENHDNPHFDLDEALHAKVKACAKDGAVAVVFYNDSKFNDGISFNSKDKSDVEAIPVLYATSDARKKYFKDESVSIDVIIDVSISEKKRVGHNVLGFINNGADKTIILGAHYDHLGYGEDGNSLYRGTDKQIHNGADDNASGTAALMALAALLKKSKLKSNNYLFIAFSGEELGLFGSKYFVEHPAVDLKKVNYMINMDMVGRLNDSSHVLTIGGYGTSPEWGELFSANNSKKNYLKFNYDSSGTGPSDHTSFYRKDIPVLFFFTGLHKDYHRPSDDYDKINYAGELYVVKYIYQLIDELNNKGKLVFSKTRETQTTTSARFSVTLGIMPDYTFSGIGVRVDGVTDGKPAQKAGLKAGDVIIQLGDHNVSSLENYMQALSKFKKGDATFVKYKRGNDVAEAPVQF